MSEETRPGSAAPASAPAPQPSAPAAAAPAASAPQPAPVRNRRIVRRTLLTLGPVAVLVIGGFFFFFSRRLLETHKTPPKGDAARLAPPRAGAGGKPAGREKQRGEQGDILFSIDAPSSHPPGRR